MSKPLVFDATGFPPLIEYYTFLVPYELEEVMRTTANKTSNEFGLMLKGKIDHKKQLITVDFKPENVFIPEQQVSPGYIKFLNHPEDSGFNLIIHRHPGNLTTFSAVDKQSINDSYEVSLLYTVASGFCNGIINIIIKDKRFQLKVVFKKEKNPNSLVENMSNLILSKSIPNIQSAFNGTRLSNNPLKRLPHSHNDDQDYENERDSPLFNLSRHVFTQEELAELEELGELKPDNFNSSGYNLK